MVVPAWANDVQSTTIANCFRHCNIRTVPGVHNQVNVDNLLDEIVVIELEQQIARLRFRNPMDVRNLLN
ncbi:MAG: hypothetical protein BJ554DRAFT_6825 [Olpidium bornovanus]|uniref:Uncharacterized protein n=1 Tax=Olpidium bornovanus TaxID=278681 RepID=A0A8H8A1W6_9FUNG|nr:MAG: hypothetical protein BJ554DRAFT_6825 [Olpidium bornovanus]